MPKNCYAFGCCNVYKKGCGLQFYRFPVDPDRRRRWIAAVDRKDWEPTEYTWICSEHFITGTKSNDIQAFDKPNQTEIGRQSV